MKASNAIMRIILGWLALELAQMVAGIVVRVVPPQTAHLGVWAAAANLLVCIALGFVAMRSDWRSWRLGVALAVIPAAIGVVNLIEGIVFLHLGPELLRIMAQVVLTYGFAALLWTWIFGKGREAVAASLHPFGSRRTGQNLARFVAADLSYVILYMVAGTIVFPFIRDFYATRALPTMGKILPLQFLLRGPVFIAICLLLVRILNLSRGTGAVAVGAVFTIVSGIAPLLLPSGYFPDSVRWAHLFEVGISNFLFGCIVAWLWGPPKASALSQSQAA